MGKDLHWYAFDHSLIENNNDPKVIKIMTTCVF